LVDWLIKLKELKKTWLIGLLGDWKKTGVD
jgi:hypothetical protein